MKYLGSKSRIAHDILPIMLDGMKSGDIFVDAFCGGCNLLDKVPRYFHRIGNDKNEYLILMWKYLLIQENYEKTLEGYRSALFPRTITPTMYRDFRNQYHAIEKGYDNPPEYRRAQIGWYGFMGSFNGRFFDGGYSGHNVNGRDYIEEQIRNTLKQVPKLSGVEWHSHEYYDIPIPNQATIYCDIPYKDTKQYTTSKNFDYQRFYQWCRQMKEQEHRVFVSEYQMPEDFKLVWEKQITNSMNTKKTYKPVERLFTL